MIRFPYPAELIAQVGKIVHVAGRPAGSRIEPNRDKEHIDHLIVNIRVPEQGIVEISLNTRSLRNLAAGFDPRVRLATRVESWTALPSPGIFPSSGFDYAQLEAAYPIPFAAYERTALEKLLMAKAGTAELIEAWGELYLEPRLGIHQVHSRRASPVFPVDHAGHDGAIRFLFSKPKRSELFLLKFYGQP